MVIGIDVYVCMYVCMCVMNYQFTSEQLRELQYCEVGILISVQISSSSNKNNVVDSCWQDAVTKQ